MTVEPRISLEITHEQAKAVSAALDLYSRIGIGQMDEVAQLVRDGFVPMSTPASQERSSATLEVADEVSALMNRVKSTLGYPQNGSMGIGNPHVSKAAHRAYEVKKVLDQAVTKHFHPDRSWTVAADGLLIRYTSDPAPTAEIIEIMPALAPSGS